MHTYNITMVTDERHVPQLLGLLRSQVIPALLESGHAGAPRLARVASKMPGDGSTESLSLQFDFATTADVAKWKKSVLPAQMEAITAKFGDKVLTFCTLLQQLPHE